MCGNAAKRAGSFDPISHTRWGRVTRCVEGSASSDALHASPRTFAMIRRTIASHMTVEVVPEPRADVATRGGASKNPVPNGTERLIIGSLPTARGALHPSRGDAKEGPEREEPWDHP